MSLVDEGPPDGKAWVLVHGIPGSARDFRWFTPALRAAAPSDRIVRVEMPGFGATPLQTEPDPSVEARARYVCDVVAALPLERPILVGHSMGGVVGTMAATLHPERFAGLALVSSPGLTKHRGLRAFPAKRLAWILGLPGAARLLRRRLRAGFERAGFRGHDDAVLQHTVRCVAALDIDAHAARLKGLRALGVATHQSYGIDDPLIERDIFEALAEFVDVTLRFESGGHNPQKAFAVELAEALVAWQS